MHGQNHIKLIKIAYSLCAEGTTTFHKKNNVNIV